MAVYFFRFDAERGDLRIVAKCETDQQAKYATSTFEQVMRNLASEALVTAKKGRDKAVQVTEVDYKKYR